MSVETSATESQKETISIGSLVVTETGDLVLLTGDTREYGDVSRGDVAPWYPGVLVLRNGQPMPFNNYRVKTYRIVGHINDLIEALGKQVDITTPTEKAESDLTPMERLARVEREAATLRKLVQGR